MKKLLLALITLLTTNSYGMEYGSKAIGMGVVGTCAYFGRNILQGQCDKTTLGLLPAAYVGLEMSGFFHTGTYDDEGFWKKRARILLGTGSIIGGSIIAAHKIRNGEYDKSLFYSVAGIVAGLGCFKLGTYKNMIPCFLKSKQLKKELKNDKIVSNFVFHDQQIHSDLRKHAPTEEKVKERNDAFGATETAKEFGGIKLIEIPIKAEKERDKIPIILQTVEDNYDTYIRNHTSLWGLAYAYWFGRRSNNPYVNYANEFENVLSQQLSQQNEEDDTAQEKNCVSPIDFAKYVMPSLGYYESTEQQLDPTDRALSDFWRINKYLGKQRTFWTSLERLTEMGPQPLTVFTKDNVLLMNNPNITAEREQFYASLVKYGFEVKIQPPIMRFENGKRQYFDRDGQLKHNPDNIDPAEG